MPTNENRALVSVVMPVYNGSRYISDAINSVLQQTYKNWELIIVDDASTDNTPSIIAEFVKLDRRISSIKNLRNLKLPASFNIGYSHANGEFFSWLASDDLLRPNALERLVDTIQSEPYPDFVYSDMMIINDLGYSVQRKSVMSPECLPTRNNIGVCRLYRYQIHHALMGFDEDLFTVEDYDFAVRAFCRYHLMPVHEDLYLFRKHENSLTATHEEMVRELRNYVKLKNMEAIHKKGKGHAARSFLSMIDWSLTKGQCQQARRFAISAFFCSPRVSLRHFRILVVGLLGNQGISVLSRLRRIMKVDRIPIRKM